MADIKRYNDSNGKLMAIVIPHDYKTEGISFLTDNEDYQQLAVMSHPTDHIILPHYHNLIKREIDYTTETLIVRSGILQVNLYENQVIVHTFDLKAGDIVTLFSGGHGFLVKENVNMVEVKQGPYVGDNDKTRF